MKARGLLLSAAVFGAGARAATLEGDATRADPFALDTALGEVAWPGEEQAAKDIAKDIQKALSRLYPPGEGPVRRDAHPKAHGVVRATFRVVDDLDPALAHGVLQPGKSYRAWIRFSNGNANPERPDIKGDARGMAIKLTGVLGEKLLAGEREATTQDFVLISHPVFFSDDPRQYRKLVRRASSRNPLRKLFAPFALGVEGAKIAKDTASRVISSPLETRYWSTVPYRLGTGPDRKAVKYSARPCTATTTPIPDDPPDDYLRQTMIATLSRTEACFDFLVQVRSRPEMSVENPKEEWLEAEAPFVKVATIEIPMQVFATAAQDRFAENLSFTPWHSLPEHRPLGGVNRTRRVVYEAVSAFRHERNGTERVEPTGEEVFP